MSILSALSMLCIMTQAVVDGKYIMYLTGLDSMLTMPSSGLIHSRQHYVVPEPALVADITHVALAFMQSSTFNEVEPLSWPLFTTVEKVRSQFAKDTAIMVAIGGWGDTGFAKAAASESTRKLFAKNVKRMVDSTGADGKYPL